MIGDSSLNHLLDGFEIVDWPVRPESLPNTTKCFVYVFLISKGAIWIPFYVGQTERLVGRMKDYTQAYFSASTDFRVGIAIRCFTEGMHCSVKVGYKQSEHNLQDESRMIRELLLLGFRLLNSLPGYDYQKSNMKDEQEVIRLFCRMIMNQATGASPPAIISP